MSLQSEDDAEAIIDRMPAADGPLPIEDQSRGITSPEGNRPRILPAFQGKAESLLLGAFRPEPDPGIALGEAVELLEAVGDIGRKAIP